MTDNIAIEIKNLSKIYKLYNSRYDRIKEFLNPLKKVYHKKHFALKNINLNVKKGEVIGVIGKNGSGKSTLLKILASVVTPTNGSYSCNGRVTALIELSGGFNTELTGIENIFFLGAIQGFTKHEMQQKLHEILDFAEIGSYINQPVKTYSSGMQVRLAFSIAININPEILLTDEVLAVGDLRFQKKCYRKINEFKEAGKTIVICTHNLGVVKDFCSRAIWLDKGVIKLQGEPNYVADSYFTYMNSQKIREVNVNRNKESNPQENSEILQRLPKKLQEISWINVESLEYYGNENISIKYAAFVNAITGKSYYRFKSKEHVSVLMVIYSAEKVVNPGVRILIHNKYGTTVLKADNFSYKQKINLNNNLSVIEIGFDLPMFGNGIYSISMVLLNKQSESGVLENIFWVNDVIIFEIANPDIRFNQDSVLVVDNISFNTLKLD